VGQIPWDQTHWQIILVSSDIRG